MVTGPCNRNDLSLQSIKNDQEGGGHDKTPPPLGFVRVNIFLCSLNPTIISPIQLFCVANSIFVRRLLRYSFFCCLLGEFFVPLDIITSTSCMFESKRLKTLQKDVIALGSTWKMEIFTFQLQISKFASSVLDFPLKPQSHIP